MEDALGFGMYLESQSSFSSCHRHPEQQFTGFCPSCLSERLSGLDPETHLQKLSCNSSMTTISGTGSDRRSRVKSSSDLHRSNSFSVANCELFSGGNFEPNRKSCDVRPRISVSHFENETFGGFSGEERAMMTSATYSGLVANDFGQSEVSEIKVHNEFNLQRKKQEKSIAGSIWTAASSFGKRFQKWRKKDKIDTNHRNTGMANHVNRKSKETQEEFGDTSGRRSCDTDPRFSFDKPRFSLDEPRVSCDGYLMGRTISRLNPMVSVVEDDPINISNGRNSMDEPRLSISNDPMMPGGSVQTRNYYLESSRRRNLMRSSSMRLPPTGCADAEMEETKSISNSKVSPESIDYYHAANFSIPDAEDPNLTSFRDDCSESFREISYKEIIEKNSRKSQRWKKGWNVWGLINRKTNKDDEIDVADSVGFSGPWQYQPSDAVNKRLSRSNSNINLNSRSSLTGNGMIRNVNKDHVDDNGTSKQGEKHFLERSRSARYSMGTQDKGMILKGNWKSGPNKQRNSHFNKTILGFY